MRWITKHDYVHDSSTSKARYKKKRLEVNYSSIYGNYYFMVWDDINGTAYNSLWDKLIYKTKQACIDACIAYVDSKKERQTDVQESD